MKKKKKNDRYSLTDDLLRLARSSTGKDVSYRSVNHTVYSRKAQTRTIDVLMIFFFFFIVTRMFSFFLLCIIILFFIFYIYFFYLSYDDDDAYFGRFSHTPLFVPPPPPSPLGPLQYSRVIIHVVCRVVCTIYTSSSSSGDVCFSSSFL